jgi:predicted DCC family thiol-disulfide oxidoreductase YuxK
MRASFPRGSKTDPPRDLNPRTPMPSLLSSQSGREMLPGHEGLGQRMTHSGSTARRRLPPRAAICETGSQPKATTTPVAPAVPRVFAFSMQTEQPIVVDPKSPGGINSPHGLILLDGVCVLCSRGCRFVSKRDRRGYFRFVPIQLAEGRPLAEQLGINPDRPDSFAFVANGQAYVKSEAALRIARELPRWQWTWVFHFIPRVIRDAIYDLVARNRYRWFGRRDACILPNSDRSWPS